MSDGTLNFPERSTNPDTPTANRVKLYNLNGEPYYITDTGASFPLKGTDGTNGTNGIDGTNGTNGIDGAMGPAGPMMVEGVADEQATVTLPNTTTKTVIYSDTFNVSATGNCFLIISLAVRGHSTGGDYEFDVDFGGNILTPDMAEEAKDIDVASSNWRSFTFPVGSIPAGNIDINLRFSKEQTGGTAQLKGYSAILVRY